MRRPRLWRWGFPPGLLVAALALSPDPALAQRSGTIRAEARVLTVNPGVTPDLLRTLMVAAPASRVASGSGSLSSAGAGQGRRRVGLATVTALRECRGAGTSGCRLVVTVQQLAN